MYALQGRSVHDANIVFDYDTATIQGGHFPHNSNSIEPTICGTKVDTSSFEHSFVFDLDTPHADLSPGTYYALTRRHCFVFNLAAHLFSLSHLVHASSERYHIGYAYFPTLFIYF